MRPIPPSDPSLIAFTAVMAVAILFVDLSLPLGVAAGEPYAVLLLLGWWHPRPSRIFVLAGIFTLLLLAGYLFSPPAGVPWMIIANRVLSLLMIWITAGLLVLGKRAVEAREAQEERLRLILQSAVNGIVTINEEGIIESFNPAAERIFGYRVREAVGRNVTILMPEPYRGQHKDYIGNYLRTGEARIIGIGRELEGCRKDGSVFPMELAVSELVFGGRRFFTGMVTDITARKCAEESLLQEKERAQQYLDIAGTIVVAIDSQQNVTLINSKGCEVLELKEEELLGKNWFDVCLPATEREQVRKVFERLMAGEIRPVEYYENTIRTKTNKELTIAWHNTPLRDEQGSITGTLSAGADVTEHRKAEAQLHQALKMETVGRLTGGVAHDFNNLLAVNLNNLEMLQKRLAGDPEALGLAERAIEAAERGAVLTQRLLAFSREQKLESRQTDLNALVADTVELSRRTLGDNIEIRTELQANLWPIVVDPVQMENALLNLVINARDAIGQREGKLIVHTRRVQLDSESALALGEIPAGDYAVLKVNDTGGGMPRETLEPKELGEGTGLGLSMVYGFVSQSGGHAKIESELGGGTTVSLYFPRAQAEAAGEKAKAAPEFSPPGPRKTVLVVEDYAELRETVVDMLSEMGYRPLAAEDAPSALELLSGDPSVSLLFTDVVLPGKMGGVELSRAARKIHPGLKVLLTSGYTEQALSDLSDLDGSVEIIEKPYKLNALAAKIGAVLHSGPPC
jgi:PAS domain S-box-containing protein